jgi:nitrate/nitrite transporter NarK
MDLLPLFTWLEASPIGVFVKDRGATFASIEAVHLMALAMLGGAVLVGDLRLLNVVLRDVPSKTITDGAHKWFKVALYILLITGFFMLAGVATKCYHNFYYWVKMSALLIGIVFAFAIKQPLLQRDHAKIQPLTLKLIALASIGVWFIVAASGRWIGFS